VTVECQRAVLGERPLPGGRAERPNRGGTIAAVTTAGPPPPVLIPRWIQLVGLPLLLLLAWVVATTAAHVVVLFIVAALIALLLDPLVRMLGRVGIRRGFAVALVYLTFAGALVVAIVALATVVVGQTRSAANKFNDYFTVQHGRTHRTSAYRDVDRLQQWLNTHHLKSIKIQTSGHRLVRRIQQRDVGRYTHRVVSFVEGAAISIGKGLFDSVLIFVVSIYMLLGLEKLGGTLDRRFPPHGGRPLLLRVEHALAAYVRGQLALSLIIGASAGLGLYIFGLVGLLPGGESYALVFGSWVGVSEVLPYLGPWLGAVPPLVYALVVHPISAVWVAILFLGIHQLEGHLVVPNVMGSALRLHPLLVIFGLLVGTAIYGLGGALMALPLLAVGRAVWEFFSERVSFEPWTRGGPIPVEVEPVEVVTEPDPVPRPRRTLSS
jgi:predicted PurR-regulated permease PerM